MEDKLIELLSTFGYPVYRQGSMTEEEQYPDNFFTFWNTDSPDHAHYDDSEYGTEWDYNIFFYTNDPNNRFAVMAEARKLLKANGWIVPSKGYDVMSDEPTHTGRGMMIIYLDFIGGN